MEILTAIFLLPIADFFFAPRSPIVDITFNANTSFDLDENITSYLWEFGDGDTAGGSVVEHSYSSADNYTVNLRVKDDDGLLSTISKQTSVLLAPESIDSGTPSNPYPSISGTHTGNIIPSQDITVHKIYTYPCAGTGGHTEYIRIWNDTWAGKEAHWSGYQHDWHNITFDEPFTLFAKRTYHYEIITGSYPQIIHKPEHTTLDGSYINCTSFVDANGKTYTDWIPAIRIE